MSEIKLIGNLVWLLIVFIFAGCADTNPYEVDGNVVHVINVYGQRSGLLADCEYEKTGKRVAVHSHGNLPRPGERWEIFCNKSTLSFAFDRQLENQP